MTTISPPILGIDLGTTFSVMAWVDELSQPQTLSNLEGDRLTPSAVLFEGDNLVVGREAVRALATDADQVAIHPKRYLGQRFFPQVLGGRQYPPEAIQACILNKLRIDAARQIGRVTQAVITVPAYFDELRRKATQDAGYMAGLEVLDIINEPTAAALAFGFGRSGDQQRSARNLLVYDLGGGTFDVTVLEVAGNHLTALATDGDVQLGGYDWDERILLHVAERFQERYGLDPRSDPNTRARWWRECEEAKRALSVRRSAFVACDMGGYTWRQEIAREDFEHWTRDLLERTRFTVEETVAASGLRWSQIQEVILVGGATRMPAVRTMLRQLSGREPNASIHSDEAVAHGAALHAHDLLRIRSSLRPRFVVRNINSHSLGVSGTDTFTRRPRVAVLIPRNSTLPADARRVFQTQKHAQQSVLVPIVEGESLNPEECVTLGNCVVAGLPPDLPAQTPVEVRFRYAHNGRLEVAVQVLGTDCQAHCELIRESGLTPAQVDAWRQHIAKLPPHEASNP